MELNELIKNLNWKKIIIGLVVIYISITVLHELMFMSFIHEFQKTFIQFTEQFDRDQKSIHDKITQSQIEMKEWQADFDKKAEKFSNKVDQNINQTISTMNDANHKFDQEHPQANENSKTVWEEGRNQYHDKTGKWLPTYEQVYVNK